MKKVKWGFIYRASFAVLLAIGRFIQQSLTGNPNFPTPVPTLLALDAVLDELELQINASATGNKVAIAAKKVARKNVIDTLRLMAVYVQSASGGVETKILSSGFEVRASSQPVGQVSAPQNVRVETTAVPGQSIVRCDAVKGATAYVVEINTGDPADELLWKLGAISSSVRVVINGLPSVHVVWFRMYAVGASGKGGVSDVARAIVQ